MVPGGTLHANNVAVTFEQRTFTVTVLIAISESCQNRIMGPRDAIVSNNPTICSQECVIIVRGPAFIIAANITCRTRLRANCMRRLLALRGDLDLYVRHLNEVTRYRNEAGQHAV